jgi:hypothetical protein
VRVLFDVTFHFKMCALNTNEYVLNLVGGFTSSSALQLIRSNFKTNLTDDGGFQDQVDDRVNSIANCIGDQAGRRRPQPACSAGGSPLKRPFQG